MTPMSEDKQTLIAVFRERADRTREAKTADAAENMYHEVFGLLLAGLWLNVLGNDEYNRLGELIGDACAQRRMELAYHAPLFTGADRAKAYGIAQQRAARALA